jgi:hypothetical protein
VKGGVTIRRIVRSDPEITGQSRESRRSDRLNIFCGSLTSLISARRIFHSFIIHRLAVNQLKSSWPISYRKSAWLKTATHPQLRAPPLLLLIPPLAGTSPNSTPILLFHNSLQSLQPWSRTRIKNRQTRNPLTSRIASPRLSNSMKALRNLRERIPTHLTRKRPLHLKRSFKSTTHSKLLR